MFLGWISIWYFGILFFVVIYFGIFFFWDAYPFDILGYFLYIVIYFGIFLGDESPCFIFSRITTSAPPHGQDFSCAPGRQRVKAWQSFDDTLMQMMHVCTLPYTSAHILNRWHIYIYITYIIYMYIILYHMCVYARVAGTFLPSIRRSQMVSALGATITLQALPSWVLLTFVPPCATNMILIIHLTLWWTNIAIENGHLQWIFPLKMVIFHCYVSSPEGIMTFLALSMWEPQCHKQLQFWESSIPPTKLWFWGKFMALSLPHWLMILRPLHEPTENWRHQPIFPYCYYIDWVWSAMAMPILG